MSRFEPRELPQQAGALSISLVFTWNCTKTLLMLLHLHSTQSDQRRTATIPWKIKALIQMHVQVSTLAYKKNVITRQGTYLKEVRRGPFYWGPWWWPRTPEKCIWSLSRSLYFSSCLTTDQGYRSTFKQGCGSGSALIWVVGSGSRREKIMQIRIRFNLDRWIQSGRAKNDIQK